MTDLLRSFDSVGELLEVAHGALGLGMSSETGGYDFCSTDSLTDALELGRVGWKEHLPMVKSLTDELEHHFDNALVNTFEARADVFGSVVDMGKFLSGEPECMIDFTPVKLTKVGRVVSIHVNSSYSSGVSTDMIVKRGAAIVALVDMVERTGNTVEVITEDCILGSGTGTLSYRTVIKASSEPVDLPKLLFVLAHPSWLRRVMFAIMECEPRDIRNKYGVGRGYGRPGECVQAHKDAIIITRTSYNDPMIKNPEEWIRTNLTNLGLLA